MVKVNTISKEKALEINSKLKGIPTEDRVLVFHQVDEEKVTSSGLVLPGTVKEHIIKKGVIVSTGVFTDTFSYAFTKLLVPGIKVIFGDYAGKMIEPEFKDNYEVGTVGKFSVLSINEIVYIES